MDGPEPVTEINRKTAIVLFNLGGPDRLESVRPFLFNLFNDSAIIGAPGPLRWALAQLISRRRAPVAREIYGHLGGASPLLANTEMQARALERALGETADIKCFISMRYWYPMAEEVAQAVKEFGPDRIVLLPLYPQYSATTTGSSLDDWRRAAGRAGLKVETHTICCYPDQEGFVASLAGLLEIGWREAAKAGTPRVLLSAHGLPKFLIERGDPYQWQVERTAGAVAAALGDRLGEAPDWLVTYQSRVGPREWIGPYTNDEIERAGRDGVPLVIAPIAFVSEHSETLVELDIEYRRLADGCGVPAYVRTPAVGVQDAFIGGLAKLVLAALQSGRTLASSNENRICPVELGRCPGAAAG